MKNFDIVLIINAKEVFIHSILSFVDFVIHYN